MLDKNKEQYKLLKNFILYRLLILDSINKETPIKSEDGLTFLANMMSLPVTKKSKFSENQWDYNYEAMGTSANCRGSTLIVDYDRYVNIPPFIKIELKCLTHLYYITPNSFRKRGRKKKKIKPSTLVGVTKRGLAYIDTLFKMMGEEFGQEYIHSELYALTEVNRDIFQKTARIHKQTYSSDLKVFLDNVSHPLANFIFGKKVECDDSNTFEWKLVSGNTGRKPQQVMNDDVFEKLVFSSSLLLSNFLISQGIEPVDKISVDHLLVNTPNMNMPRTMGIDNDVLNAYTVARLKDAGYDDYFVSSCIEDNVLSRGRRGKKYACAVTIRERIAERTGFNTREIKNMLDIIYYASQYIFAQFTGMRPSELSETPLDCIIKENDCYLIEGKVIKGRECLLNGLFDDKWIAIPIVRDAVRSISILNKIHQSPNLLGSTKTAKPNEVKVLISSCSIAGQTQVLLEHVFGSTNPEGVVFNAYMTRHTLAYQMYCADVGLPFISYQLKHLVDGVGRYTSTGESSDVTLGYGGIGEALEKGTRGLRKKAEIECIKAVMNPDGTYLGKKGKEHKERMIKVFQGYMAEGYTKDQIYEALAEQGVALINVGQGFCYGGRVEDFDESLPCIGSLRCNPIRCSNAIVTKVNAPKWREIYLVNKMNIDKPGFTDSVKQMREAMNEAKSVLEYLGEEVNL